MAAILALIPKRATGELARGARGCGLRGAGLLFVFANKLTTAASTVFLQATNPLFVVALAPWLLRERVRQQTSRSWAYWPLRLALLLVGGQRHFATAPDPFLGNVLAAGSAVAWAFTSWATLAGPPRRRGPRPIAAAAACGNLIVFLVCLPGALPLGPAAPPTG